MPSSNDKPNDETERSAKLRKYLDAPLPDGEVIIGRLVKRIGGSPMDIDRHIRGYLRRQRGATPSDDEVAEFIATLEQNPVDLESIEGWISEETLFRWLDKIRGHSDIRRFDFAVAVAALMCLRWLEVHEEEASAIAEFEEDAYESCLDPRDAICEWARYHPEELRDYLDREVIPNLERASVGDYWVYANRIIPGIQIFAKLDPHMQQALIERMLILDPSTPAGRRSGRIFLESLLGWLVKTEGGYAGEFHTPRTVVNLMVGLVDPNPGERIYDPCFGTGGLLAAAARRTMEKTRATDAEGWGQLRRNGIYGRELNDRIFILGLARLVYEGIDLPRLEVGNSLETEGFNGQSNSGYDCILANPPFGLKVHERFGHHFPFPMKEGDGLFLQHVVQSLRPGGRAVVLVPSGVLFASGRMAGLRRFMVEENHVEQVVSLPKGALSPFTAISVNLLVLRKGREVDSVKFLNLTQVDPDAVETMEIEELSCDSRAYSYELTREELADRDYELVVREAAADEVEATISELGRRFPDLEMRPLGEVATLRRGANYRRENLTENSDEAGEKPVHVIRVSDVNHGRLQSPDLFVRSDARDGIREETLLRSGDTLVSISGSIGKVAYCQDAKPSSLVTSGLALIRSKKDTVSKQYLFSLLSSEVYQRLLSGLARGTAVGSLPIKDLKRVPIPIPPIGTQVKVVHHTVDHLGDAFFFLERTLSRAEDDPFVSWIEESRVVEELVVFAKRKSTTNRLLVVQDFARSLRTVRNEVAHGKPGSHSSSTPEFLGWLSMMADASGKLTSIASVEDDGERFNLLSSAALQCKTAQFVLPGGESTLNKRAEDVTHSLERVLQMESGSIRKRQRIDGDCPDVVSKHESTPISVLVRNYGPLPLRDVQVTELACGEGDGIPYVPVGETVGFTLHFDPDSHEEYEGNYPLTLLVEGLLPDDSKFETDLPLAVAIAEAPLEEQMEALVSQHVQVVNTAEDIGFSPYSAGNPVPDMLFGRERLLKRIYRQLGKEGHTNVIILEGNRRNGKSSILKKLERGEETPDWVVVYIDCQKGKGHATREGLPTEEVWRSFALALGEKLIDQDIDPGLPSGVTFDQKVDRKTQLETDCANAFGGEYPFQVFESYLKRAIESADPRRVLFLLDEFDKLQIGVNNKVTSPDVFANIRHLVHNLEEFSIIIAGTPLLKQLRQEHWSALYGFGVSMQVSFLPEKDARELIVEPVSGRIRYTETAISEILRITAGQPYLVQYLCDQLFENLADDPDGKRTVSIDHVKTAKDEFVAGGQHFNDLWGYAGNDRRRLILAIVQRSEESDALLTLPLLNEELLELGVQIPKGQKLAKDLEYLRNLELIRSVERESSKFYRLQIPLFGDWIKYHHPFDEVADLARDEAQ